MSHGLRLLLLPQPRLTPLALLSGSTTSSWTSSWTADLNDLDWDLDFVLSERCALSVSEGSSCASPLPERTPLCTEFCDGVLRESAEQLAYAQFAPMMALGVDLSALASHNSGTRAHRAHPCNPPTPTHATSEQKHLKPYGCFLLLLA